MKKAMVLCCVLVMLAVGTLGVNAQSNDAWIPALGSFVLPGLGQLLNDEMDKAILHFGVSVAVWTLGFYGGIYLPPLAFATPALALAWHIYSGFDAYNVAKDTGFTIGLIPNGFQVSYNF